MKKVTLVKKLTKTTFMKSLSSVVNFILIMVFPIFTRNLLTLYTKWIVQVFECCISPFSFKYMEAFKCILITIESHINPFVPDAAFLYPLET